MAKKIIKIKPHTRKLGKKTVRVKGHKRKQRKLGKKIKFKKVGSFMIAHDEFGNVRGSKIVVQKKRKKRRARAKRKRMPPENGLAKLNQDFFTGKINVTEFNRRRREII